MLYDTLNLFRDDLKNKFANETVRTYITHIKPLLKGQKVFLKADNLDIEKVLAILAEVKYKNNFAKYKNAFLHFCQFLGVTLDDKNLNQIKALERNTHKKYRKLKEVDTKAVVKKINSLKNQKLKLSYKVMLATGLRVGELTQITKDDCLVKDDELCFFFIGKGGKPATI